MTNQYRDRWGESCRHETHLLLIEYLRRNHFNIWKRAQVLDQIAARTIVEGLISYACTAPIPAHTQSFVVNALKNHITLDTTI